MVAQGKRAKPGKNAAAGGKKKRKQDHIEDDNDFFLASDDERDRAKLGDAEEESEEEEETVEQKRLRLAKDYLQQLRDVAGDDEQGDPDDLLSQRLAKDADEAVGRLQRRIASRVVIPSQVAAEDEPSTSGSDHTDSATKRTLYGTGRFARAHRLAATGVALTTDDRTAFTVSKDGTILSWDVETMNKTQLFRPGETRKKHHSDRKADWLPKQQRQASAAALCTVAVSSDGRYLAVGGGDKRVHVFDARTGEHVQEYPGHKDIITGLAFREGTHQLLSTSYDRTVKLWSLDDRAYVDSLFGHHAPALAVDMLRSERAVTAGQDRTCRVWKIPEESQLVFRPPTQSVDCCRYITSTEWVTGATDGSLQVWSQMKKKPVSIIRHAHGADSVFTDKGVSAGGVTEECSGWVQSVAVCRGSDLVASGAGDGMIRLWKVEPHLATGGAHTLSLIGGLPARGYVNGLQIARSGRFVVAALGQEPRMGRWGRDSAARNGFLMHSLELADESS